MRVVEAAVESSMISHAQNGEDVVLRRVFADVAAGFYVDVGASDPVDDSVTLHFYEQGWSGVNVEPDLRDFEELSKARVRDVNIHAAVGLDATPVTFYPSATRGQGTLVRPAGDDGINLPPLHVPQIPLRDIFAGHAPAAGVDFLKVDVEGWEAEVLASTDWEEVRPRVVVVEAIDANGSPAYEAWEPALLGKNYRFALYDGLNRFYCRAEDAGDLLPRLAAPANVLDNWRLAREVRAQEALVARVSAAEAALEVEQGSHAATARRLTDELAAHAHTREVLEEVHASTSWRITAPLRDASRLAKVMRRGGAL